jgi:site-specific recombinase XerD
MFVAKEREQIDTIDAYCRHMKAAGLSKNTIASRESVLHGLSGFLTDKYGISLSAKNAKEVKGYMLDEWYQQVDASPPSKNLYVANVKGFFEYMTQAGYVEKNASDVLKKSRIIKDEAEDDEGDRLAYTNDDAVALIKVRVSRSVDVRDRAMVAMLLAGGFRASELCSLNVGDYKGMRNGSIYVKRKGGAKKWVYVADYALEYVDKYLEERGHAEDDEPLFTTRSGRRFNRTMLWERMNARQKELGLETGVHIMRHTFLTEVDRRNPLGITQKLGSHSSSNTTKLYINPTKDELRGAANSVSWGKKLNAKEERKKEA